MAINFIQPGKVLDYLNESGSTITSGSGVVVNTGVFGIAGGDIADDVMGAVWLEGVFELAKVTNAAFVQGDKLFWDDTAKKLTKVSSGNTPAGICFAAADQAATTGQVKLGGAGDFSPADMGEMTPAAAVEDIGTTEDLTALEVTASALTELVITPADIADSDFTAAVPAEPTKDEIDAGIDTLRDAVETGLDAKADNADVETLRGEIEDALDDKADNADVETLRTEAEARIDIIEAKIDELLDAMRAANLLQENP